jgi:hypothetical protein
MNASHNAHRNLTLHFKVKDFGAWRQTNNSDEKGRSAAGITNGQVFRSADDPNDVVILQDWRTSPRPAPGLVLTR